MKTNDTLHEKKIAQRNATRSIVGEPILDCIYGSPCY
jgi:hypothetical protein